MAAFPSERPNYEKKRNLAKSLLKKIKSGEDHAALRLSWNHPRFTGQTAHQVREATPSLSDCQLAVARESGFDSWTQLKSYVEQMDTNPNGPIAQFERAVRCIIHGETDELRETLKDHPKLATARSRRSHHAVLPHYVAANGVENEHQKTPGNIVEVAEVLIASGADAVIDATSDVYGGGAGSTPLVGLVTSCHPAEAGAQPQLVRVFCAAGAKVNGVEDDGMPLACALTFRYPSAADALQEMGARIDNLVFAAALGRTDIVTQILGQEPSSWNKFPNPFPHLKGRFLETPDALAELAFVYACMAGQIEIATTLLDFGVDVNAGPNQGATALHESAFQGNRDSVRFLLSRGADCHLKDRQWNSTAAEWATWNDHDEVARMCYKSNP